MAALNLDKTKFTVTEVARAWQVSPEKVRQWIRSGQLRAVDVASRRGGRPRYRIDAADLAAFEAARSVTPALPVKKRKRKTHGIIEFF